MHLKSWLLVLASMAPVGAQDPIEEAASTLQKRKDDVGAAFITKIAEAKSPAAADALVKGYDVMSSIAMRLEVVKALGTFDGVAKAEQAAFEKLASIAINTEDVEVREAAIRTLGQSTKLGKQVLKQLVDSDAPETVREPALKAHVAMATPADAEWYRYIWNPKNLRHKYADGTVAGIELNAIRELAFGALAPQLNEAELVEAMRIDLDPKIRRAALRAMSSRDMPKTTEMANWMMERVDFPGVDRSEAARILVRREGAKAFGSFLELAKKRDVTQADLREEMARLIVEANDDAMNKKLVKLIGSGKPHERVFVLMATQHLNDPKVLALIRKELADKDLEVRRAAAEALGKRKDKESLPALRALLEKSKLPGDQRLAIEAISAIEGRNSKWLNELSVLTSHAEREVRNAALDQLVLAGNPQDLPTLFKALEHADWTTRLIAVKGCGVAEDKQVVPKLIARLEHEQGRMLKIVSALLWKLTGQPFDEDVGSWKAWWAAEGEAFKIITPDALAKAEKERDARRMRQRTRSGPKFFGIKLESHRVIFIIDTSGSMLESINGKYGGKRNPSRIDVAKQELATCIKNLDQNAQFNVYAFSSGIGHWLKGGIADSSAQSREAALTWVERLGATGATNLYDVLKLAFEDKDVDTMFVLSDGEPTAGEIIDAHRIREEVALWNKHRNVKIHSIAIGGNLEILEWLSADSGGDHVRIR